MKNFNNNNNNNNNDNNWLHKEFFRPSGQQSENPRKRKERMVFRLFQRTKKVVEHEGDGDTDYNWSAWNGPQRLEKRV